jgi:murein DD-endopeptidase MepM/ murein hydrolase activator NlpD
MKKNRFLSKISVVGLLLVTFFVNSAVLLAEPVVAGQDGALQVGAESQVQEVKDSSVAQQVDGSQRALELEQIAQLREAAIRKKEVKKNKLLSVIREQINSSQNDFQDISGNIAEVDDRLDTIQKQAKTLSDQMTLLDLQIKQTEGLILNVTMQVGETENELMILYSDMEVKKAEIENQKQMLVEYLQTLYEQESDVSDTTVDNSEISVAKLLFSDQTAGEQLKEIRYFSILENTGHEIFDKLEQMKKDMESDEKSLQEKKDKLGVLNERLVEEKRTLYVQKNAKQNLLKETKGQEKIYQEMLAESIRQQDQVQADMDMLTENLKLIERKASELGDKFNPDDYSSFFDFTKSSVYEYINSYKGDEDAFNPGWPVNPLRGITAYFHDSSYKSFFGIAHNAIDIRLAQGSVVRSPADGIVYRVRNNGYGYSYLIIAHKGGFMTTYGHVSEFKVQEGEKVFAGEAVALSGGTPGSKGAGLMTTGAHLHFEMTKDGKYVDPLYYLPLSVFPAGSLSAKYDDFIALEKPKVKRGDDLNKSANDSSTQEVGTQLLVQSS